MNYISYSLWGEKPIYNVGAIRNSEQIETTYPNWKMVVYYDNTVPEDTIKKLEENNVMCYDVTEYKIYGMFWRFFAVDLPDSEYAIFRDSDSRITIREKLAVDEWIASNKTIHVMRDHPYHMIPCGNDRLGILGGMWGIKSKKIPLTKMIKSYPNKSRIYYGEDQTFLKTIFSLFEKDRCTHDDFFEKIPFPIKRENGRFIGERIDENENPLTDDYKMVL